MEKIHLLSKNKLAKKRNIYSMNPINSLRKFRKLKLSRLADIRL